MSIVSLILLAMAIIITLIAVAVLALLAAGIVFLIVYLVKSGKKKHNTQS